MSHYAVAVIHTAEQDVDELLAPFDEGLEVEPYVSHTKPEIIEDARERRDDYLYNLKREPGEYVPMMQWYEELIAANTDEELYKAGCKYHGYDEFNENGDALTTYNPDSKWDWYSYGGRFGDFLKLKTEAVASPESEYDYWSDSAQIKNIDFSMDQDAYEEALRFWDVIVDHKPLEDGEEEPFTIYCEEYYRDYYGNRETYAKYCASFTTYAVLTSDGDWHEPGQMGWFGMSNETPESFKDWHEHYLERFVESADPDMFLTIVDCHI